MGQMPTLTCFVVIDSEIAVRSDLITAQLDISDRASLSLCFSLRRVANLPIHLAPWQGRFVATPLSHL